MAITLNNTPGWGAAPFTNDATLTLATHAAGDRLYAFAVWKPYTTTATVSGWTELIEDTDGAVASGSGVGSVKIGVWYKDAASSSETNPTIDFSTATGLVAFCTHYVVRKDAAEIWGTPATARKAMTTWTTSIQTEQADATVLVPNSAMVIGIAGLRDDSPTFTRPTNSPGGIDDSGSPALTWAANYVEAPANHAQTTTGDDLGADMGYRMVTTGAAGTTLSMSATISAAETGFLVWVVQGLQAVTVTPTTASLTTTTFAPTVTATTNVITVDPGALVLATFAPTVTTTTNVLATPTTASLITTRFAPTVTATGGTARSFAVIVG